MVSHSIESVTVCLWNGKHVQKGSVRSSKVSRVSKFKEMIQTVQEKSTLTSKGLYCHYVWCLLRSWRLWDSSLKYGKNSQQDVGTLCNKAPLLKDMKKWTPRRREFKFPFPKQPRLILLHLKKKFPVLTAPEYPSLASKTLVIQPYLVQFKLVYITEIHVPKDYSNMCTLSKIP